MFLAPVSGKLVGTVTFKPLKGEFIDDTDTLGKMDPYCKVRIGRHSDKTAYAKGEGRNPTWNDTIMLDRKHNEQHATLKIRDKDRMGLNDKIGKVKIDLDEIAAKRKVHDWYPIYKGKKNTGHVLVDIEYYPHA